MRLINKIPFAVRNLALTAALATVGTQANAVLVADGIVSAGEYSVVWQVGFQDNKGNLIGNGHLYFGQNATGQFLYFQMPLEYVDNTYGTNASAGWGGPGKHTFSNLLSSDSMGANSNFQWTDKATGTANAARIDYIANCQADPTHCNTAGYRSGGVGSGTGVRTGAATGTNGAAAGWKNMDVDVTGSAASILEIATSLEYDLKNIDPTATTNSSLLPGWVKEVGYEIQFKPGTFDAAKWANPDVQVATRNGDKFQVTVPGLLTLGDPQVSPPMKTFGQFTSPCLVGSPGCGQIPEPGTTWLLAGGLAGMLWYSRRRKEALRAGPVKVLQVRS